MLGMKITDRSIVLLVLLGPLLAASIMPSRKVAVVTGGHDGGRQATSSQN